jgi:hypothetical protein
MLFSIKGANRIFIYWATDRFWPKADGQPWNSLMGL